LTCWSNSPRRHFVAAIALAALAGPAVAQFLRPYEPLDPAKAQSLPLEPLSIESGGKRHAFQVEVADTDRERATGLMHRTELAPDRGMLFDFKKLQITRIWMRKTFIPLDLLFMERDGTVAATVEHMVPHAENGVGPERPMLAVLELQDGTIARLGLKVGDVVRHRIFKNTETPR
jgi:uncharacterized membrane protein (UPF0127 family)